MLRTWLFALGPVGLLTLSGLAGCLSICPWEGVIRWDQPGLYEGFPPSGTRNGYRITWDSENPEVIRGHDKEASKSASGDFWLLSVEQNDSVLWLFEDGGGDRHGTEELREMLKGTYRDIGLGSPPRAALEAVPETGPVTC